jgi:hypothetical protein
MVVLLLTLVSLAVGQLQQPFGSGYAMANLGAIMWPQGVSAHQPWKPAAFCSDTLRMGVACAGTDYFDAMNTMRDKSLLQVIFGGWYEGERIQLRGSWSYLSVFELYEEQSGFLSLGSWVLRSIGMSVELSGHVARLRGGGEAPRRVGELGAALWVPLHLAGLSVRVDRVKISSPEVQGFGAPPRLALGIHTRPHRYGAQGVLITLSQSPAPKLCCTLAQEYWLWPQLGLSVGIQTSPLMVGMGVVVARQRGSGVVSLVHHPLLGWSRGFMAEVHR